MRLRPRLDVIALHDALDSMRKDRGLSWRQVAEQTGVHPSLFTRLSRGLRPDVDAFAAVVTWLGLPAETFIERPEGFPKQQPEPVAHVMASLRAVTDLSPQAMSALEEIFRVSFHRLKDT